MLGISARPDDGTTEDPYISNGYHRWASIVISSIIFIDLVNSIMTLDVYPYVGSLMTGSFLHP